MASEQPIFCLKPHCSSSVVKLLTYRYKKLSYFWQTVRRICNDMGDLHAKHTPHVLPCRIWSFCVKGC